MFKSFLSSTYLALGALVWAQAPPSPPPTPPSPPSQARLFGAASGAYLGVGVIEVNEAWAQRAGLASPAGVEVANVAPDSPAAQAGLEKGDVVTKFRGETVQGVEHFVRLVRETPVGRSVELEVASASGARTATVVIGERRRSLARMPARDVTMHLWDPVEVDIPHPSMLVRSGSLGATLESVSGQFAQVFGVSEGVLVREVEASGSASTAGLQAGDVIVSIEDHPVARTSDIRMALSRATTDTARVEVMRGKARKRLEIQTGRKTFTKPFEGARPVSRPN